LKSLETAKLQAYLQGSVGPRPIAFASTVDENGNQIYLRLVFFNVFSANPPILVFSPARVRDIQLNIPLINCEATKEVVINVVNFDLVQQTSLASTEYADGVNEFDKAFTAAFRFGEAIQSKESPVQFECKVNQIIPLGTEGGAEFNTCDVRIHIDGCFRYKRIY
jgi:flavin reductase (DIM6/NTAB) family NADH-FMN oxidoreductase RutF